MSSKGPSSKMDKRAESHLSFIENGQSKESKQGLMIRLHETCLGDTAGDSVQCEKGWGVKNTFVVQEFKACDQAECNPLFLLQCFSQE